MDQKEFEEVVNRFVSDVKDTLVAKGDEYVPGGEEQDRFHNFNVAAVLNGENRTEALWGFLSKHIVSLADMVKVPSHDHSMAKWDEKIGDAIAYLLLLKAMVVDNEANATESETFKALRAMADRDLAQATAVARNQGL